MVQNLFFVSLSLFNTVNKPLVVDNDFCDMDVSENISLDDGFENDNLDTISFEDQETDKDEVKDNEIFALANDFVKTVEEDLRKRGTSIEKELNKQSSFYKNNQLLESQTKSNKRKKIEADDFNRIDTLDEMIAEYKEYKESGKNEQSPKKASSLENSQAASALITHTAVVAYFSANNYILAAELLTHMRENNEIDSIYRPMNSNIVTNSDVFKSLANNNGQSASFEPNSSSTTEQDLYFAIHDFLFSKSRHNDAIVLTDRYDFRPNQNYLDFIQGTATNMMYLGQTIGVLKPFYTVVSSTNYVNLQYNVNSYLDVSFNGFYDWQYKEVQLTLGYDDFIYLYFNFPTSGYRTIQTLGDLDTELILYVDSANGTQYDYNDDEGYKFNALINCYFQANRTYALLVRFYNYTTIGNTRVIFTPTYDYDYDDISQIVRNEGFWTSEYNDILVQHNPGRVSLFTLAPALSKNFTIETTKKEENQDTTLYFIDPRRGDSFYKNSQNAYQFQSCIFDDDGGVAHFAKIELTARATTVPYLIVACSYSSSSAAKFNIKISGLNSTLFDNYLLY